MLDHVFQADMGLHAYTWICGNISKHFQGIFWMHLQNYI